MSVIVPGATTGRISQLSLSWDKNTWHPIPRGGEVILAHVSEESACDWLALQRKAFQYMTARRQREKDGEGKENNPARSHCQWPTCNPASPPYSASGHQWVNFPSLWHHFGPVTCQTLETLGGHSVSKSQKTGKRRGERIQQSCVSRADGSGRAHTSCCWGSRGLPRPCHPSCLSALTLL